MEKSKWISHSSLTNHNYCSNNHKCCNCNSYRLFCCILLEIVHLTSDTFQAIDIHCFLSVFFISVFYACSTYWYSYSNTECLIVISYAPNYANPISLAPAQYSCSRTICSLLETEITNIVQSKNRWYYTILISKEKNNNEWQFQESVRPLIPFSNTHSINYKKYSIQPKKRAMMIPSIHDLIHVLSLVKAHVAGNTMTGQLRPIYTTNGTIYRVRVIFKIHFSTIPHDPWIYHRRE